MITLGNKDFGVWDFSSESISLGVPYSQMNSGFAESGQNFSQFWFFWFFKAQNPQKKILQKVSPILAKILVSNNQKSCADSKNVYING